ncbi:MAG: DUF305 domain-containing protein [Blastochloris viridis]|uniref:DUF305 domain-containing protein n=1 Tax=Blastochloris viridis TaxID=1079 RepID=A0A6N4RFU8_BLAVI|nr:MAG: DUF305 domain-containing protein [Blastochloris viridis]
MVKKSYLQFGAELIVDFVLMYLVMYTMIDNLSDFYLNLNNVYMTLMMVAPMAIVMLIFMRSMFPSRMANIAIILAAVIVFGISYYGMRSQMAVGDKEFIKSMIPHHSGAVLMCREAKLNDPELLGLCQQIIGSQNEEISQMKRILDRL